PAGVPIRQAVKNHRIDHAEHGRIRAYAQRQSHDSHSRETWVVVQHAKSVADVLQQRVHFHRSYLKGTMGSILPETAKRLFSIATFTPIPSLVPQCINGIDTSSVLCREPNCKQSDRN